MAQPARAKAPVFLAEREISKPIGVRADTLDYVTVAQFNSEPKLSAKMATLSALDYRKQADFTIARLKHEPKDLRVGILGGEGLSRDEIISEVKIGSPIGKQFVQIERAWVERLKEKISRGEYRLRAQAAATSV